jgi:hypothetical protein
MKGVGLQLLARQHKNSGKHTHEEDHDGDKNVEAPKLQKPNNNKIKMGMC